MSEEDKNTTLAANAEDINLIDFEAEKKSKKEKKEKKEKKDKKDKKEKAEGEDNEEEDEKKKKKKKEKAEGDEKKKEKADVDAEEDDEEKKKKKKEKKEKKEKKKKDDSDNEEEVGQKQKNESDNDDVELLDFTDLKGSKKKKEKESKSKFEDVVQEQDKPTKKKPEESSANKRVNLNLVEGYENYAYEFLLNRISETIKAQRNDQVSAETTFNLKVPQCSKTKTKSTWLNFDEQVQAIGREHRHMLEYFLSELGCDGTVGSNNEMILVGGYQAKHFLRLTKKYVEEYVKCNTCKGFNTYMEKEASTRLTYLKCKVCTASRTVQAISTRFTAVKRGQRRKERQ